MEPADLLAVEQARALRDEERFQEAINLLEEVLTRRPSEVICCVELGYVLLAAHRPGEAVPVFDRAILLDPAYAPGWGGLGRALKDLGRWPEAEAALRTRLSIRDSAVHQLYLAMVLTAQEKYQEAVQVCERAIALNPAHDEGYVWQSFILNRLGAYDKAVEACNMAIELNPGNFDAHLNRAKSLLFLGKPEDAKNSLNKALDIAPDTSEAYFELGNIYNEEMDNDMAITYYRHCAVLDPSHEAAIHAIKRLTRKRGT